MEIKELKQEDWKQLRELYLNLLKTDPEAFVDEYDDIASRTEDDWKKSLQKKGKTFIATDNGKFIGMGRINLYEELPGVPVLHKLGVLPEFKGRGIAKKLVEVRENWAKSEGFNKVRLYVVAKKEKTIEFSKNNGFHVLEGLKETSYKKDGTKIDVVVMEKCLI